jgi:hypothetical protein
MPERDAERGRLERCICWIAVVGACSRRTICNAVHLDKRSTGQTCLDSVQFFTPIRTPLDLSFALAATEFHIQRSRRANQICRVGLIYSFQVKLVLRSFEVLISMDCLRRNIRSMFARKCT